MLELLFAFILWAVVHSLTAGTGTKLHIRRLVGERAFEGTYRLVYNIASSLTLLPIFYLLATRLPDTILWSVPMPYRLINYSVQLIGGLGLLMALLQTDVWHFLGIRQFARYLKRDAQPESSARFVTTGTYGLVRHPLYLFSLLFLWANPVMSWSAIALNLWVTIYFVIGSIFEERRLIAEYGEAYRQYQAKIPRLIPLPWQNNQTSATGK